MTNKLMALTWNLHYQSGREACDPPKWVVQEVADADIVILTEAPRAEKRQDLVAGLEKTGFRCAASENAGGNDVLIAVKQNNQIVDMSWVPCYGLEDVPENLIVKVKLNGINPLTVVGVRIKSVPSENNAALRKMGRVDVAQAEKRLAEFKRLLTWVEEGAVLIGGDFNPYREYPLGSEEVKPWNSRVLRELAAQVGLDVVCPVRGSSIGEERSPIFFKHDRFLTRGLFLEGEPEYRREFTERDRKVYTHGRHFRGDIQPGYPDHALLTAQFQLAL